MVQTTHYEWLEKHSRTVDEWFVAGVSCYACYVIIGFNLFPINTGTAPQCSNLHFWVCCCYGSAVSGSNVTNHWILCRYLTLLYFTYRKNFPSSTL